MFGEKTSPEVKETNPKPNEIVMNDSGAWTDKSKENFLLQPKAKHIVPGKVLRGN